MRYLLLTGVGGYFFYRLSLWDFVGAIFAAMFLFAAVAGLCYRDRTRRPLADDKDE